ncbi:MAG: ABC transporter substrate-binding protein [Pseudomonadota bacterium]
MNVMKMTGIPVSLLIPTIVLLGASCAGLMCCTGDESVPIGFAAQLTGVQAELGVQERNGVQLAMEDINASGGIAGRPAVLVVRDDLGTPEGARSAARDLVAAGVLAIIGHATSELTIAGLTVTNPARVVMISPTASAPELGGKDDYFFRVSFNLVNRADALARHVLLSRGITRLAVVYNTDNTAYSKAYLEAFQATYQALGGTLTAEVGFSSRVQPDFTPLVIGLRTENPGGLLMIAADNDTAMIAQRTRLMHWAVPLFATAWSQTETLLHSGGQAVEGLELEIATSPTGNSPGFLDFTRRYRERYGHPASFGAALGYETAKMLATALQETGARADGLKQALEGIRNFKGLNDTLSMDRYGDVVRPFHLGVVRNGKYDLVTSLKETKP